MKYFFCIFIIIFFTFFPAVAQSPYFKKYKLGESFPGATVNLVYEDQNSILWFGAKEGLFLYDGIEFQPFLKSDSTSNHVRAIFQDQDDKLWVGYEDGSIYYLKNQQLKPWTPEEGVPAVPIAGFTRDLAGRLWIATYGEGLYYLENGRLYNINADDGLLGNDIYVMLRDPSGQIWIGTDNGISICSVKNGKKTIENLTRQDGLPDEIVRTLIADQKGNIWIGTYDGGVCLYNLLEKRIQMPLPAWENGIVSSLEIFEGNELWIGTESSGIWRFQLQESSLIPIAGWGRTRVYDLHKDVEGNIWVVSNTSAIYRANRQFEFVTNSTGNIQAILADRHNRIWTGTSAGLFLHYVGEKGNSYFVQHLKELSLNIVSLFEDVYGNILIGTFDKGLFCFNPSSGKMKRFTVAEGLTNNNILSIDGENDQVWLATLGGVTELNYSGDPLSGHPIRFRNFNQESGLGTNFIYSVFVDSKHRTWFGTDGKGISVLEDGVIRNYPVACHEHAGTEEEYNAALHTVYSITEDKNGNIWLSTDREGIFEFDGKRFAHLAVKEGIGKLEITSLISDGKGKILIVHPNGLDILTPEKRHLIYYDEEVGIQRLDPHLNAVCKDKYGNVWIGTHDAIIKYTALNEKLEIHPRTLLNNVSVFLEPVDFKQVNYFGYQQNNLVFSYMGLWYTDPKIVRYRYQLEGYDRNWIESKDRQATYSNLPPGKYTFMVTSTENDAWSDEPIVRYAFEVAPPLWMRWWIIAFILLVTGGFFYGYIKMRDRRLQKVNLLEREKAESELAALKAQINPHFLFNSFNTLITVIEEDPDLAVEYVEKMSDFYRSIMQLRDKELISLSEEVELVKNYAYLLQKRYGDNFRLHIDVNGTSGYIVPLSLQILVENAIKHNVISKSKPLTVDIRQEDMEYISISNNLQSKIKKETSTHFGLQSLARRYEMLGNKKVKIEESNDTFKISIPVLKS